MAISAPDGGQIEISFALEYISLKADRSKEVQVDFLIKNIGDGTIRRFRFELPCRLMSKDELRRRWDETLEASMARFCQEERSRIILSTNKLIAPNIPATWLYSALPHVSLGVWETDTGLLKIIPDEMYPVTGVVKHDWKSRTSEEVTEHPLRWYACFVNGITVVDFVAPKNAAEHLHPGESMWVSVEFIAPAGGTQYVLPTIGQLAWLKREQRFPAILMSPRTFSAWRTRQLDIYLRQIDPADSELRAAVQKLRDALRSTDQPRVKDWRLFMRWSNRMSIERIYTPPGIVEPHSDHHLQTPEGILPASNYDEFWFGENHQVPEPEDGFRLEFRVIVKNWLYEYVLPWLGFIAFWLALWRWINFLCKGKG